MESATATMPTTATATAARVEQAVRVYGSGPTAVRALDEVSIAFPSGRFTAIMGPSGSGKSTLLHCQAGLDQLDAGRAFIGDTDLGSLSERDRTLVRRQRLGFVFQAFNLLPALNAHENVVLPHRLSGEQPDEAWVAELVAQLGLADRLQHRPSELSGGQQQRVAVARALVTRPELIFADEPTGNLDSKSGHGLLEFLRKAVDELNQTVVMVTHDPAAAAFADEVAFLADGRLIDRLAAPSAADIVVHMTGLAA